MTSKLQNNLNFRVGPVRVVGLGDSVTQNDSFQAASGLWTEGNGYYENAVRLLAGVGSASEMCFVANAGIGGNTTPQMLARLDTDVLALKPDVLFLMAGTNDILPGAVDADYLAFFTTLEKIIVRCLLAGTQVILSTCPTKDAAPAEVARAIPWYYMLAKHYGVPLLDAHKATADPITGQYKSGYSDDGTHPNQTGIAAIERAWNAQAEFQGGQSYRSAVAVATPTDQNLILNGNFVNETVPPALDFWSVNTTGATFSAVSGSPYAPGGMSGKTFEYKKTAAGGVYALFGASIPAADFADGDVLVFSGLFGIESMSPVPGAGFTWLMQFDSADSFRPYNAHLFDNGGPMTPFSQEAVVPVGYGGVHDLTPQLFVQDIGNYRVGELTCWNRTKYEAVYKPGAVFNNG